MKGPGQSGQGKSKGLPYVISCTNSVENWGVGQLNLKMSLIN